MSGVSVSVIDAAIRGAIVGGFIMIVVVLFQATALLYRSIFRASGNGRDTSTKTGNVDLSRENRISDKEILNSKIYQNKENASENKIKKNPLGTSESLRITSNSVNVSRELKPAELFISHPDFAKAVVFFPELKMEVEYLAVFGSQVQTLFVEQVLERQAFQDPSSITSQLVSENLQKRFGQELLLQEFGKELLVGRLFAAAQELEDYVRVVGSAASPIQIIEKVKQSQSKREVSVRDRTGGVTTELNRDSSEFRQERVASDSYSLTKVFLLSGLIILPILAIFELATSPVNKMPPSEQGVVEHYEERAKKCSLGRVAIGDIIGFDINNERLRSRIHQGLNNLKSSSHDWLGGMLEFQNMNSFGVSQVQLGFTDLARCPDKIEAYKFAMYCGSTDTESGVAARSFGKLTCMPLPQQARGMNYCMVGFVPFYNRFKNGSFLEFMEQNGFC